MGEEMGNRTVDEIHMTTRLNRLMDGLEDWIGWAKEHRKEHPEDFYNDGYDKNLKSAVSLMKILGWVGGENNDLDDTDFDSYSEMDWLLEKL